MELGLIGLPNSGKSTLFNALTGNTVPASPYPFCTVEPNIGIVEIPDLRLEELRKIFRPEKTTRATVKFTDLAGLVKGASSGEGLGNKFLAHIRDVDALVHVLRDFSDPQVTGQYEGIDPIRDMEVVNTELILSDLDIVEKNIAKTEKIARTGDKEARNRFESLKIAGSLLEKGLPLLKQDLGPSGSIFPFLTKKPLLYIINTDCNKLSDAFSFVRDRLTDEDTEIIPVCAKIEEELSRIEEKDRQDFRKELGIEQLGLENIIRASYRLLDLITFFTVVGTEVRAWNLKKGSSAVKAAGKIHSDMEKGFIKAEVFSFNDLSMYKSEQALHEKGFVHIEGRDYLVKEGDIIRFRFKV